MTRRPSLLAIDDHPENIEVLYEYLHEDYDLHYALSGPEGLALAGETRPELILLDVMMPDMDGYAVCAELQRGPGTQDVPVIFVTAKSDAESESRALAAGAVDFIHKPINRDVVRARVRMHLALKARERELRQVNVDLERRVEERTQALRDALVRAEAAHRAKHLFLANINHELRTPMNAILGLSDLLARQMAVPKLRERADRIKGAGQQLLGIIDNVIEIADLQAGRLQIDALDFDVLSVIDSADQAWRGQAEAKGLALTREVDPALPRRLRGDPARLGQVLSNLLDNAVKFSEQGQIILRARSAGTQDGRVLLRCEVEDQGVGIDPERLAGIFDAFEQADNSGTRRYAGAGLGLAVCRQWVGLMGGRIGVDRKPGRGSLFWVVVPLERGAPATAEAGPPAIATAPGKEASQVDGYWMAQVLVPLHGMLMAGDDIQAYILWAKEDDLLEAFLGKHADAFKQAMEGFEFKAALRHLEVALADHPAWNIP